MNRTRALKAWPRAFRATAAAAALAVSTLTSTGARADDPIGIVLSASPSGAATKTIAMRIPAEATAGSIPIFVRQTTDETLYGVGFFATPLRDEKGVGSVTPALGSQRRTIPRAGAVRRIDVSVAGVRELGTFTSTLYATHGNRTQTLGTLTVAHTRRNGLLQIASIEEARSVQQIPGAATRVTLLVTVKNSGDTAVTFAAPVIAGFASGTAKRQADMPRLRVSDQDGRPPATSFRVAAGDDMTLRIVLDDLKRTGAYAGSLRISAPGHDPVEQTFAFEVKQGPAFPAILIALGVATAYLIRRRYSSGRIGRAGQRRLVSRLLADLHEVRDAVGDLEPREALILATAERRLVDISDELELARSSKKTHVLSEIDHKIDLFLDLVAARQHVRAMKPPSLQEPFEPPLDEVAGFLTEPTPPADFQATLGRFAKTVDEIPRAVEATVRQRFHADVDRFLASVETSATVSEEIPLRVLERVSKGKELADAGRFADARSEVAGAQLSFARVLAEDLLARMPDADSDPPGFVTGWQRFRASTAEGLRVVRRERRGERAAEAYRRVWQDYVVELATRLKSSATRERRAATGSRKDQLSMVVEACDDATAKAFDLDPAAVDAYRLAVEGYLAPAGKQRGAARRRSLLEETQIPPPMTAVAAGLGDVVRLRRPSDAAHSAAALTRRIRTRHFSLALIAGIVAVPVGLALLWAPNDTWGTFADGATVFLWGFGLVAITAMLDARRFGWSVSRDASSTQQRVTHEAPAPLDSSPSLRPGREPAT